MPLILSMSVTFILTIIFTAVFIPVLRKLKIKQTILEIGPSWHKAKTGTPTMGGVCFMLAIIIAMLYFRKSEGREGFLMLGASLGMGIIGSIDDYFKVINKRNLGLRAWQKFSLQTIIALAFVTAGRYMGLLSTKIEIPFINFNLDLGILYLPFATFVLLATTNAVNLTDGIDGLVSSVTSVVMMFFLATSTIYGTSFIFPSAIIGGLLGFLMFNAHPAKVFMGDTGSLFLGGAVGCLALTQANPLSILLIGIIYLIDTVSVIIQVVYYKFTKKRFFKMAPIHHHFEKVGWSEVKIVFVSVAITVVMCIIALLGNGVLV